jgi:hypothetical protein
MINFSTLYYSYATLDSVPIKTKTLWVSTIMKVGEYQKEFTGVDTSIPDVKLAMWRTRADMIAKNIIAWVRANAEQLKKRRPERESEL